METYYRVAHLLVVTPFLFIPQPPHLAKGTRKNRKVCKPASTLCILDSPVSAACAHLPALLAGCGGHAACSMVE
eukprot:scaffold47936_cov18-Tisochrysis_lutea.AAC.2